MALQDQQASLEHWDAGSSPGLAQWITDPALLQLWHRSQLQLGSDLWPEGWERGSELGWENSLTNLPIYQLMTQILRSEEGDSQAMGKRRFTFGVWIKNLQHWHEHKLGLLFSVQWWPILWGQTFTPSHQAFILKADFLPGKNIVALLHVFIPFFPLHYTLWDD